MSMTVSTDSHRGSLGKNFQDIWEAPDDFIGDGRVINLTIYGSRTKSRLTGFRLILLGKLPNQQQQYANGNIPSQCYIPTLID